MLNETEIEVLKTDLGKSVVEVTFKKINGEIRVMTCTLIPEKIPKYEVKESSIKVSSNISCFDLNANGWRSFRKDSVLSYKVLE